MASQCRSLIAQVVVCLEGCKPTNSDQPNARCRCLRKVRLPKPPHLLNRAATSPCPLVLGTCLSTFWTGAVNWNPIAHLDALGLAKTIFVQNLHQGSPMAALEQALAVARIDWQQGLSYMGVVMALLLAHEMGHFLMALRHRIPASLPYIIPLTIAPFGTLGAVIGMEGSQANLRQLFDLGVAGPLMGLAVTLPVTLLGIRYLPATPNAPDGFCFHNPLISNI